MKIEVYLQERSTGIRRWIATHLSQSHTAPQEYLLYYDSFLQKLRLGKYFFLVAIRTDRGEEEVYTLNGGDSEDEKNKDI